MSWYSSWLPGLPTFNFAIPSSIQGRFLSFVLKKSLGHLVKPGQLDHHQIDSQIGSGYVQVNDLELSPEAINTYLDGLPVTLESGTISSIKARIPWPNPLASTLGFSLKSLHLVFHVIPFINHPESGGIDLSESVASVAENFIHQELSPVEEATIWKSFHQDSEVPPSRHPDINVVPGGLDESSSSANTSHPLDSDPAGVSLFSSLIESLLARFEFDVEDVKITLIHPGNISLTLSLDEIQYHTTGKTTPASESAKESPVGGASRTLSITGLLLSSRNLASGKVSSYLKTATDSPGTHTPNANLSPPSLDSSQSSMDDNAQFMMSQSLAGLPPRPPSSAGSVSSSMYESAISQIGPLQQSREHLESSSISLPPIDPPHLQPLDNAQNDNAGGSDEMLISFGSQPISIQLKTPPPVSKVADEDVDPFIPFSSTHTNDQLQISVSIGIVACAIHPWQVQAILSLSQGIPSAAASQRDADDNDSGVANLPPMRISGQIRGIVAILVPSSVDTDKDDETLTAMRKFFEKPLVPPVLEHGCTRLYLDTLVVSIALSNDKTAKHLAGTENTDRTDLKSIQFSISDFSMFLFSKTKNGSGDSAVPKIQAFPLLLTDPHLISQYSRPHNQPSSSQSYPHLPVFDVINWTDEKARSFGTKLSQWRCQPPRVSRSKTHTPQQGLIVQTKETASLVPAPSFLSVVNQSIADKDGFGRINIIETTEVQVSPLNIRVDLEHLLQPGGPLSFFEDLLPHVRENEGTTSSDDTAEDLYASTWNIAGQGRAPEGPRFDDPQQLSSPKTRSPITEAGTTRQSRLVVNLPMIRLAIRSPPPRLQDRSGTLIVDLHNINIGMGAKPPKPGARFSQDGTPPRRHAEISDESMLLKVEFSRLVVACSMVGANTASTFASIGSLAEEESDVERLSTPAGLALQPRIYVIRPSSRNGGTVPSLALSVDIPAAHVDITKPEFDDLQYWADDISQLLERLSGSTNSPENPYIDSRDGSLIGSRFFAKSRSGSGSTLTTGTTDSAESVVKLTITEAFVRIMVPRSDSDKAQPRPIELKASDVDVLLELNPDNRQQTILTLGIMDLVLTNTDLQGNPQQFLSLTSPRSLSASPKSLVKLRFSTTTTPNLNTKETRIKLTLSGFTYCFFPDIQWISDLTLFSKNPPGTFESVIPSDRTRISIKVLDGSIRLLAPKYPGSVVFHLGELDFSTDVVDDSRGSSFNISATGLSILAIDNIHDQVNVDSRSSPGLSIWLATGYALVAEIADLNVELINQLPIHPSWRVIISRIVLRLHLCADTLSGVTPFIQDLSSAFKSPDETPKVAAKGPTVVNQKERQEGRTLMSSVEDLAFKKVPAVGPAPDMIYDDLPTNLDYLDESFGTAAGLRELRDEDLDEFEDEQLDRINESDDPSVVSRIGGETIKIFDPSGLGVVEDYFLTVPPEKSIGSTYDGDLTFSLRILDGHFTLFLYDGYDWVRTRRTIEEEVKEMRKRLAKIRQLVANGQMQDPTVEDTSAWLYNSVHIGLNGDDDMLAEPSALLAAIDEELKDDLETASQSSWQSLKPTNSPKPRVRSTRVHGKRLTRSKGPSMEFSLAGAQAEFDQYNPDDPLVSRTFVTVRDLEILDHIKTSTWKKFLTGLRSDSRGNVRETDSNMVRIELRSVRPIPGHSSEEARLRAKILPLRLYVDQDAVDFLKKFFSFKDPQAQIAEDSSEDNEAYIQLAEIFPIDLKLDYKPRRVDYRALKEGRTIELMNFFHFDGAEMTLRHITLAGVTGWPRLFEMLNDLWTPDVKATQLVEVISGVAPIRSVVNVGSGVADLILLPIAQYKKDGRIVRGMQKGATAFVKSTAIEAIKMGAKLATGTQVILEQAEGVLGGQFENVVTAEPLQVPSGEDYVFENEEDEINHDLISKYAQQPTDLREGVQSAYKSLQRNLNSAAQTILAVPMEVYERSGNEGPVRSVIRAVPIAVLKPMIGASEAISKTLLGLHNTLDPNVRHDTEAKYKLR